MSETKPLLGAGRRGFLGAATTSLAGIAVASAMGLPGKAMASTVNDTDILNFALNLEYLEAQYYSYATTGMGLPGSDLTGTGTQGTIVSTPPTPMVTFTNKRIQAFAQELATDEMNHVVFLRSALGSDAVAQPSINIGTAFDTLAQAAGIGSSFDPFSSEINFLLGGFIFEDVGVTAYLGAAPLISSSAYLSAAAAILGVEAYHAGAIRTYLLEQSAGNPGSGIITTANKISLLRDQLDGPGRDDQGLTYQGNYNITPVNASGLAFARSTTHVLDIVYGDTTATPGLFFPNGMNGVIH